MATVINVQLKNSKGDSVTPVVDPQTIFDIVHPIGEIYVQYPSKLPPEKLYKYKRDGTPTGISCTWEAQKYYSAFFRAEKSNLNDPEERAEAFTEEGENYKWQ